MIDPSTVCFYHPPEINKGPKAELFKRISKKIVELGGTTTQVSRDLEMLPLETIPVVGCSPQLTDMIAGWRLTERQWIYWDRGYWLRVYATWLPRGPNGGMYRWHVGSFQQQHMILDASPDRYNARPAPVREWQRGGSHIVIARPSATYCRFHRCENWLNETVYKLSLVTGRQLIIRDKESRRPLQDDIKGAHCLVTHGSNTAIEAVILGCPVFVDPISAAYLVGKTNIDEIEEPIYPDRTQWLYNLANSQFDETELVDGTLWRHL